MTSSTLTYRPLPGTRLNMAHPLAKDMVLCMLFNEQGSRAMDLSPSGAHGRLSGFGSPAKRTINGLQFTAATPSYIEIPAVFTQLNFTSEDFSLVMRIYADTLVGNAEMMMRGLAAIDGWRLYIRADGRLNFATFSPAQQQSLSALGDIVALAWHTIGFSRAGNSARLFNAGIDVTTTAGVHNDPLTSARSAKIGIYDDLAISPLSGKIEFLYVYGRRKLSEAEHKAIHENPYAPYGYKLFL